MRRISLLILLLACQILEADAQEYVDICDCAKGVKGICKEYLAADFSEVKKDSAVYYYYNYSFGKSRFYSWGSDQRYANKFRIERTDTSALQKGSPIPLEGQFLWYRLSNGALTTEMHFHQGWPRKQLKEFSKAGYLKESLDFDSPFNKGRFSMIWHFYHHGKLEIQSVIAVDMEGNNALAWDMPATLKEPPMVPGFLPQYRRSLLFDIQGLQMAYINERDTPSMIQLLNESSYAPSAEPLCYLDQRNDSLQTCDVMAMYGDPGSWQRHVAFVSPSQNDYFRHRHDYMEVHLNSDEYMIMRDAKTELNQNKLRHILISMDTLQHVIQTYGDTSAQFKMTIQFVDRCVNELMQAMRINQRELDWNCVLVTSSESSTGQVPWILWGEGVRAHYRIDRYVTLEESRATFSQFAHLKSAKKYRSALLHNCFHSKYKRQ